MAPEIHRLEIDFVVPEGPGHEAVQPPRMTPEPRPHAEPVMESAPVVVAPAREWSGTFQPEDPAPTVVFSRSPKSTEEDGDPLRSRTDSDELRRARELLEKQNALISDLIERTKRRSGNAPQEIAGPSEDDADEDTNPDTEPVHHRRREVRVREVDTRKRLIHVACALAFIIPTGMGVQAYEELSGKSWTTIPHTTGQSVRAVTNFVSHFM